MTQTMMMMIPSFALALLVVVDDETKNFVEGSSLFFFCDFYSAIDRIVVRILRQEGKYLDGKSNPRSPCEQQTKTKQQHAISCHEGSPVHWLHDESIFSLALFLSCSSQQFSVILHSRAKIFIYGFCSSCLPRSKILCHKARTVPTGATKISLLCRDCI